MDIVLTGARGKRINFATKLDENQRRAKKSLHPLLLAAIALAAVILLAEGVLLGRYYFSILPEYDELTQSLADPVLEQDYTRSLALDTEIAQLAELETLYRNAKSALQSYPRMDEAVFSYLERTAGMDVTIRGYYYDNASGALSLDCVTESAIRVSDFVHQLRVSGEYDAVEYFGFTKTSVSYEREKSVLEVIGQNTSDKDDEDDKKDDKDKDDDEKTTNVPVVEMVTEVVEYYSFGVTLTLRGGASS